MKLENNMLQFGIFASGLFIAYGIHTNDTNTILAFGFLFNAIVTLFGASKK